MGARFIAFIGHLPLWWAHLKGAFLGWLFVLVPNRHRRITRINLERCYPELSRSERRRLERRSLVETGKTLFETPRIWVASQAAIERMVPEVEGRGVMDQAVAEGRGVVLVAPHLGSWELVNVWSSIHWPMTSLYTPLKKQNLEGFITPARGRFGAEMVQAGPRGVRGLYQALGRRRAIGVPPDQDPRESGGAFAPFFGIPARTMTLIPRLLQKSGAVPVLGFAERLPGGRGFRMHFRAMDPAAADEDLEVAAAAINRAVEAAVRKFPEQYQWSYKRFRTRPEGEGGFY